MRRVFLWLVLALFVCSAGVAFGADSGTDTTIVAPTPDSSEVQQLPSEALLGFGLFNVYSTDQPIILRGDNTLYYGNVRKFIATDTVLAAQVKSGYSGGNYELPKGTLTDTATGLRYTLYPGSWIGNFCEYDVNTSFSTVAGHKVMWNLFTSPDVTVGAAVIPESSTLSVDIANDEIVPYVKINYNYNNSTTIGRIDLYFVKSGDWSTQVYPGTSKVNVTVNSSYGELSSHTFTNFNKVLRNSFTLGRDESELQSITVEYEKGGAKYIWNFAPIFGTHSSIEFGELALENQPITIEANSSLDVTIKLPARFDLTDYFNGEGSYYMRGNFLQPGNSSVVEVDDSSVSFKQGSASWDDLEYKEEKSTLSFRLLGVSPGRTVLRIDLPEFDTYYREINVVSEDGEMHLDESADTHGLTLNVSSYASRARFVNGKPYYPSAEFSSLNVGLVASEDVDLYGSYIGLVKDTTTKIHRIYYDWSRDDDKHYSISSYSGVRYDTDDSSINSESPGEFNIDGIDGYSVWFESPEEPDLNIASVPLSALMSGEYMTTAEQLKNFVPYFEMKHASDDVYNIVALDWSFINSATGEKVTPEVSNVRIDYEYYYEYYYRGRDSRYIDGTSGTIELGEYNPYHITISYTYKGVNYSWDFERMEYNGYVSMPSSMKPGTSQDITVYVDDPEELEAVDLVI